MATGGLASNTYARRGHAVPRRQNFSGPSRQSKGRNGASQHGLPNQQVPTMQGSGNREEPQLDIHKNQRMVSGLMHMIGCGVKVTVANGTIYEGILSSVSKEGNLELQFVTPLPQDGYVRNREPIPTMFFHRNHYISFCASNLDLRGESFTDSAITRANGQTADGREMRKLVAWEDTSDSSGLCLEDTDGSNGWDAEKMFEKNEQLFNVKTTYQEDLSDYTVPVPQFATKAEQIEAERKASEQAREIESTDGYKERMNVENNPEIDEETKFSSVLRPSDSSTSSTRAYIPPARRQQHQDSQGSHMPRGVGPMPPMHSHQPLPQRERRADRDRGDRNHEGRGERDRGWERNPPRVHHPVVPPQQGPPAPPPQPKDNHMERPNGDRRVEPSGRSFGPRPGPHLGGPPGPLNPHHGGPQGPPNSHHGGPQGPPSQHGMPPGVAPLGHPNHAVPNLMPGQHVGQGGGHGQHGAPQGGLPPGHHSVGSVPTQPHLSMHKQHHQGVQPGSPGQHHGVPGAASPHHAVQGSPSQHHPPHPHTGPGPRHSPQPVMQGVPSQHAGSTQSTPSLPHPNPNFQVSAAVSTHPQQGPPQIPPPAVVPSSAPQGQVNRVNQPASVAMPSSSVGVGQNVVSSQSVERPDPQTLSPHAQHPQVVAAYSVPDKKSPREKDTRQEQQVAKLRQFQKNFNVTLTEESAEPHSTPQDRQQQERRTDSGDQGQSNEDSPQQVPAHSGPTTAAQATSTATVSSQASSQQQSATQASTPTTAASEPSGVSSSTLNPLASEFRPRQQPPQPAVMQVASPAPSATPPSQGPRQSPGMMSHHPNVLPTYGPSPFLVNMPHKMMAMGASQPQPSAKSYQPPKRVTVSAVGAGVDPAALAHNATGQPLTLGVAQGATMQQPSYVYMPPNNVGVLPQGGPYQTVQMRMMPSIAHQGAGMDPSQGASSQQAHVPQPFIVAHQQPVPAHMPTAQALTQNMPQPAHLSHQSHPSSLPPISQNQSGNPIPSASPVQHMGHNGHSHVPGTPSMNPSQGGPPTSVAPQSQIAYGHQMAGLLPPQGAAPHAMPAHSVSQAPNPAMQYLHQHPHQHQLTGGVSFSQTGATVSGPVPAHVQSSGHQTQHVVVMPHPPPHTINQAPMNNHQQHAAAAAQFQQQMQAGAANQLHGPMAHNQHLLQGSVPNAGPGMAIPQHMAFMPQGVQGSPNHHSLGHGHPHSHQHQHSHQPAHSFQGGN